MTPVTGSADGAVTAGAVAETETGETIGESAAATGETGGFVCLLIHSISLTRVVENCTIFHVLLLCNRRERSRDRDPPRNNPNSNPNPDPTN